MFRDPVWRLAWLITAVWTCSVIADAVPSLHYNPPVVVHGAMTAVCGWAFGRGILAGGPTRPTSTRDASRRPRAADRDAYDQEQEQER